MSLEKLQTMIMQIFFGEKEVYYGICASRELTNRFHVAMCLFSNRSQMMSKCSKNKKVAHEVIAECVTDVKRKEERKDNLVLNNNYRVLVVIKDYESAFDAI